MPQPCRQLSLVPRQVTQAKGGHLPPQVLPQTDLHPSRRARESESERVKRCNGAANMIYWLRAEIGRATAHPCIVPLSDTILFVILSVWYTHIYTISLLWGPLSEFRGVSARQLSEIPAVRPRDRFTRALSSTNCCTCPPPPRTRFLCGGSGYRILRLIYDVGSISRMVSCRNRALSHPYACMHGSGYARHCGSSCGGPMTPSVTAIHHTSMIR